MATGNSLKTTGAANVAIGCVEITVVVVAVLLYDPGYAWDVGPYPVLGGYPGCCGGYPGCCGGYPGCCGG